MPGSIGVQSSRSHPNRCSRVVLAAVAVAVVTLVLAGCRTTVEVAIVADDSGGGTITATVVLDKEAFEVLGGQDVFVFDDLHDTAWGIPTGSSTDDGGYSLVAERTFTDAADLQDGLDELAGKGVFTNTKASVTHGFASSDAELSTDVSVTGSPAQFSDEALTEVLGGLSLGYTPEELSLVSGGKPLEATMKVSVDVPAGEPAQESFDLTSGEAQSQTVSSQGTRRDSGVIVLGSVGILVVLAGLAMLVVALVARNRS